ncbi:regulatory protein, luxR family [Aeromonas sp. RU39B]|jgi:DNA-binding NarL/FixJ family response regulator|uniref:LuxR C-terminal-related transcriptional regulator n=1 Tax=Aeromonas sp. RU39B TaxID=1907416 RepID=UPI000957288B|nr:LuxR C-terminal-related transcriptional regulator [Aeromonas sp. RU39B]SIR53619.1 regulatory protein, luxR family [Aeromonas sp. RU39B]
MSVIYQIGLITKDNLQADTLRHYLMEQLVQDIALICNVDDFTSFAWSPSALLLVDQEYLRQAQDARWHEEVLRLCPQARVVLLNAPEDVAADMLLPWPSLSGLFFRHAPLSQLVLGTRKVLAGEMWLPRQVMGELLEYYRSARPRKAQTDSLIDLTIREQEIMRCLMTGASNSEIASSLFVSEHTIKSHLYNVFKKINVRNRLQAVRWAKENLDSAMWH